MMTQQFRQVRLSPSFFCINKTRIVIRKCSIFFRFKESMTKPKKNRQKLIDFNDEQREYCQELFSKPEKYKSMWHDHVTRTPSTRIWSDLVADDVKPLQTQSYRARPRRRELKMVELQLNLFKGMLKKGNEDVLTIRCLSQIVFAPKKKGTLGLCIE